MAYTIRLKKNPINPNNAELFVVETKAEIVSYQPAVLTNSSGVVISSDGYSVVGSAGLDGLDPTLIWPARTNENAIDISKENMIGFNIDLSSITTETGTFFYGAFADLDYVSGTAGNRIECYVNYNYSTVEVTVYLEIVIGGASGGSATRTFESAPPLNNFYLNFYADLTPGIDSDTYRLVAAVRYGDNFVPVVSTNITYLTEDQLNSMGYVYIVPSLANTAGHSLTFPISIVNEEYPFKDATVIGDYQIEPVPESTIEMSYSIDGGRTFNNPISRVMGEEGDYTQQVKWSRLGVVDQTRVLRFYSDSKVKFAINKIEIDIDGE